MIQPCFVRCKSSINHTFKRFININTNTITHKGPSAVLFSNSVLFPQRVPTAFLIHLFAKQNHATVDKKLLETLWNEIYSKRLIDSPLYTPGVPLVRTYYKKWIMDTVKIVLDSVSAFNSPLRDTSVSESIQYRVYTNLINGKAYLLPRENLRILNNLRKLNIPVGIVANSSPFFSAILSEIHSRLKSDVLKPNDSWIPYVNAAEDGIAKPNPAIILKMLKKLKIKTPEDVYYIGDDVELDFVPAKSLGIHSVLLTSNLPSVQSDLRYTSERLSRQKMCFRISDIRELERVFFPKEIYKKPFHPRKKKTIPETI